jgi:C4-dicarboxylate-specific signal transduction histidine kinase
MFVAEIHSLDKILANVSSEIVNYESELVDNIKELKKAQNQIIEAEKLAALGNLVSGIAHEVNTPLGVSVTANSYIADNTKKINERLLNRELTKTDFEKYLNLVFDSSDMVSSNLERAAKLISDFKSISVTQTNYVVEEFNFNKYLYKITNVLRSIYKKRFQKLLLSVMKILK